MATTLITEVPIFVFSSKIGDIELSTDQEKIEIVVEDGTTKMFKTSLYAFNGKVTIVNIGEVLENYMRANGKVFTAFTIYYNTAEGHYIGSFNLNTLYCSLVLDGEPGVFGSFNFLTTLTAKRVPAHTIDTLSFLHGQENGSLLFHCVYETESGEIGNKTFTLKTITTDDIGVSSIQVSYDTIYLRLRLQGIKVIIVFGGVQQQIFHLLCCGLCSRSDIHFQELLQCGRNSIFQRYHYNKNKGQSLYGNIAGRAFVLRPIGG